MGLDDIIESAVLSDDEFLIKPFFLEASKLDSPLRLRHGYVCICREGRAELVLNMNHQSVIKNKLFILFPNEIVTLHNISSDFSFLFIRLSSEFMSEILFRFPPSFVGFIKENFYFQMPEDEFDLFYNEFFRILEYRYNDTSNLCRREIIANLLRNFFLDIYNKIKRNEQLTHLARSRKNLIMEQFCELVMKNFKTSREVAFYADKLFITPKYLSMILKELDVHKRTAKEWIDNYTITEIKLMLKSSSLSILEISNELNFPSLSFLCKYFKSRTGLTPKEYRRQMK
ncbi:helix-turn-helix domain-containing protein [Dysgonomonas sp. OttesenSCG-928-M03]|nr:helix-turn-helix domain-containing protein [Dysgonomonas sp. OttesenSCG-928-M03]